MASPKAKYIEAAYELLVEEGLENASIRKIAARAGTSSTALYKHFDNIDELKKAHDKANELSLDFAASVTSVPYHAGAAKYFSEKGFSVATK